MVWAELCVSTFVSIYISLQIIPSVSVHCNFVHSVDLWSFGVIVYELLFKEHPFYEDRKDLLSMIKTKNVSTRLEEDGCLSEECCEFVVALLQLNPDKRNWATIQENGWMK